MRRRLACVLKGVTCGQCGTVTDVILPEYHPFTRSRCNRHTKAPDKGTFTTTIRTARSQIQTNHIQMSCTSPAPRSASEAMALVEGEFTEEKIPRSKSMLTNPAGDSPSRSASAFVRVKSMFPQSRRAAAAALADREERAAAGKVRRESQLNHSLAP